MISILDFPADYVFIINTFFVFTSSYFVKLLSYKRKETHSPHFGSKPIMFNTLKIINYCVQLFRNQYRPKVAIQNISCNNNQKLPTTCILKSLKNQVSSNFKKFGKELYSLRDCVVAISGLKGTIVFTSMNDSCN